MKEEYIRELERLINLARPVLDSETIAGVMHYFGCAEYEMAFEGLVLDLIKAKRTPPVFDFASWRKLAVEFGLDRESVFDGNFWPKFLDWGER